VLAKTLMLDRTRHRCYSHRVEENNNLTVGQMSATYRSYPETFFSGALSEQQMDDMYKSGLGLTQCGNVCGR
jgi:hypothetical protein